MSNAPRRGIIVRTRFAIAWEGRLPDEHWIGDRFDLLCRTALPSLQAQTDTDFAWVLQADETLVDRCRRLFARIDPPGREVHWIGTHDGCMIRDWSVLDAILPEAEEVLTVRLDSDDGLAVSAIGDLRMQAATTAGGGDAIIHLSEGVVADTRDRSFYRRRFLEPCIGPFTGYLHRNRKNILYTGGDHTSPPDGVPIHSLPGIRWLQLVHGANADNTIPRRGSVLHAKRLLKKAAEKLSGSRKISDKWRQLEAEEAFALQEAFPFIDRLWA